MPLSKPNRGSLSGARQEDNMSELNSSKFFWVWIGIWSKMAAGLIPRMGFCEHFQQEDMGNTTEHSWGRYVITY